MNDFPDHVFNPDPSRYLTDNYIVIDIETTNKDKGDALNKENYIVIGCGYSPIFGDFTFNHFKELEEYLEHSPIIVGHGLMFELKWAIRDGMPIEKYCYYDTLLGEYVLAGNRKFSLDLDSVSLRYGGIGKESLVSNLIDRGICPSTIPPSILKEYCVQDVHETARVFLKQREVLKDNGLLAVLYERCLVTPMLADVTSNGLFLDKELVTALHNEAVQTHSFLEQQLNSITGGINMGSPQQVADFLYNKLGFEEIRDRKGNPIRGKPNKRFPDGQPLTDADTIKALKPRNKEQKEFLKLKLEESKLRKQITTYTSKFVEACDTNQCYIYGKVNQAVSATHRLTSSDPNLQNIDRKLKKVITARVPGNKILSADYRQLEFRTAGLMAQDKQALADILSGHDVHAHTSKTLTLAGQPTNRQDAKAHTFKPLYGGTSGTKAEQAYYREFKARYPMIDAMHNEWIAQVLSTKQLRTITGLILYFPKCNVQASGYIVDNENIRNYPVQMFATADIAPMGTTLLWHQLKSKSLKSFIVNLVHDSTIQEVYLDEVEIIGNLVKKSLSKDVIWFFKKLFNIDINYPLDVDININSNWDYNKEGK